MLNHRVTITVTIILLAVLYIFDTKYHVWPWSYLIVLIVFFSAEFYGAAFMSSNFHVNAITKGKGDKKTIALTFDDGPSETTEKILNILREEKVPAAFFVIGNKIRGKEALLQKLLKDGHLICNHSFEHNYWYDLKRKSAFIKDIKKTNDLILQSTGKRPRFFRPPYGVLTPSLGRAIKHLDLEVIGWNIRSFDTKIKDRSALLTRIKGKLKPGSILLLHDTLTGTELVVRDLISYLRSIDYEIVPLDQLIEKKAYA